MRTVEYTTARCSHGRVPAALLAVWLAGCAGGPETDFARVAQRPPVPRIALLSVAASTPRFGSPERWTEAIVDALDELRVFTAVVADEKAAASGEAPVDVRLSITLSERAPGRARIEPQSAFLDFLLWSTLSPISWWIDDVSVDPGLDVSVQVAPNEGGSRTRTRWSEPLPVISEPQAPIVTSLRDRYPFLDWTSLGVLVLPPFVFRDGDDEHLEQMLGAAVPAEVARKIALRVKVFEPPETELLSGLEIVPSANGPLLELVAADEVGRVEVWASGTTGNVLRFPTRRGLQRLSLDQLFPPGAPPAASRFLHVLAISRKDDARRYSIATAGASSPSLSARAAEGMPTGETGGTAVREGK